MVHCVLTNLSNLIHPFSLPCLYSSGFIDWPFMSTHFWGEDPSGTWHLEVHNDAYSKYASEAKFFKWTLELLGTELVTWNSWLNILLVQCTEQESFLSSGLEGCILKSCVARP